jgi:outer membrane protein OmpA-like peptidoglycan-associated protein
LSPSGRRGIVGTRIEGGTYDFFAYILLSGTAALALLGTTTACVTDPNTGEKKISRTAIGTGLGGTLGYLLGGAIGGDTGRIIGAGIGGSAGAVLGKQYDDQIKELKEQTAGSGVDVEEVGNQDAILVRLPDGVTFATGSAAINPGFLDTLNNVAETLIKYPNSLIDVYGFTDTTGSPATNQRLSEQRAQAVADYLARAAWPVPASRRRALASSMITCASRPATMSTNRSTAGSKSRSSRSARKM